VIVLADTSVWIDHFRRTNSNLVNLLSEGLVLMHPFVAGELACGNLKGRSSLLSNLDAMPVAQLATNAEVMRFIENRRLWGRGLGLIDFHLLVAALLSRSGFWTLDSKLARVAAELGLKK
jgi:predicted nucleic acid-binding protein